MGKEVVKEESKLVRNISQDWRVSAVNFTVQVETRDSEGRVISQQLVPDPRQGQATLFEVEIPEELMVLIKTKLLTKQ